MRVLIAGNLANMGYEIARAMIKKNVEVKLLLPKSPLTSEDPKSMYPQLELDGYPDWLVRFDKEKKGLDNWKLQIIREMRKKEYDMIIALAEFSIFALFSGKPYAALSTGSDLRELYFEKSVKGLLFRTSYKKARGIIWGETDKFLRIKKLIEQKRIKKEFFATAPRQFNTNVEKIENKEFRDKFIIFSPTAQDWRLKGNDKLLHAFKEICSVRDNVYLIISERGPDIEKSKELLSSEITKGKFQFVPLLDAKGMQYYFNVADVVADQFHIGSVGMITVEAMRCGKPVLIKLDEELFKKCYKDLPLGLSNTETEIEIFNELNRLASDASLRKELGHKNKEWIESNWDYDKLTERYISICNQICSS